MSYKNVKEILNAVFSSDNNSLNTVYKTDGEVFNLVYDDSGKPALRVNIEGFEGGSGGGIIDGEVLTFADLPIASENAGNTYIVQSTTGIPLVNRKQAGLYLSDGLVWTLIDVDLEASKISYSGDLSSDNVMDALNELKAALDGKLESTSQASDSVKLGGMTPGTGTNSILHTDTNGNVGIGVTPVRKIDATDNINQLIAVFGRGRTGELSEIAIGSGEGIDERLTILYDDSLKEATLFIAGDYGSKPLVIKDGGHIQLGQGIAGDLLAHGSEQNRLMQYDESRNELHLSSEYSVSGTTSWSLRGRHRYGGVWRHSGIYATGTAMYLSNSYFNGNNHDLTLGKKLVFGAYGELFPYEDNTQYLGRSSNRWSVVYAGTGSINTSDARLKTEVESFTSDELKASKQLAKEIGTFKFLSSMEEKGDKARKHIGMTVQRAIEIMEQNSLNPFGYGFICYDEWEEETIEHPATEAKDAEYDEEGNEISPAIEAKEAWTETKPAGDCYSFRYDELNQFILAGISARLDVLEG